jgi:hypothetical protein
MNVARVELLIKGAGAYFVLCSGLLSLPTYEDFLTTLKIQKPFLLVLSVFKTLLCCNIYLCVYGKKKVAKETSFTAYVKFFIIFYI